MCNFKQKEERGHVGFYDIIRGVTQNGLCLDGRREVDLKLLKVMVQVVDGGYEDRLERHGLNEHDKVSTINSFLYPLEIYRNKQSLRNVRRFFFELFDLIGSKRFATLKHRWSPIPNKYSSVLWFFIEHDDPSKTTNIIIYM